MNNLFRFFDRKVNGELFESSLYSLHTGSFHRSIFQSCQNHRQPECTRLKFQFKTENTVLKGQEASIASLTLHKAYFGLLWIVKRTTIFFLISLLYCLISLLRRYRQIAPPPPRAPRRAMHQRSSNTWYQWLLRIQLTQAELYIVDNYWIRWASSTSIC